ncbi:MAG: very short patch repair endonuclease [Candidatus Micrarchaeota archaeon]
MTDVLTKKQRSYNMSRIRGTNTKPELIVRQLLYSKGSRGYRIHYELLGKPDIVFVNEKVAIFIDGCFWHKCPKCFNQPTSNLKFWIKKISENIKRDKRVNLLLKKKGWKVVRLWEHEIESDHTKCIARIKKNLKT